MLPRFLVSLCTLCALCVKTESVAQTLYVPSGASGIGSSSNGNVGIGLANPPGKLAVAGDVFVGDGSSATAIVGTYAAQDLRLLGSAAAGAAGQGVFIDYYNGSNWYKAAQIKNVSNGFGNLLLMQDGGNVGIGTIQPQAKLELSVAGSGTTETLRLTNRNGSVGDGASIDFRFGADGSGANTQARIYTYAQNSNAGDLRFGTANGSTPIDRLTIAADGNLGIGTALPGDKLTILGGALSFMNPASPGWGPVVGFDYDSTIDAMRIRGNIGSGSLNTTYITIRREIGNVGIGTTSPTHKLSVNGTIRAKEVIVETTGWSDYVFAKDYRLAPLAEVEQHIAEHQHLPGIPSAKEVAEHGVSVGEMQAKLLAKIEEITLHQIAQQKELHQLRQENAELRREMNAFKSHRPSS